MGKDVKDWDLSHLLKSIKPSQILTGFMETPLPLYNKEKGRENSFDCQINSILDLG